MNDLVSQVEQAIQRHHLFPDGRILVAVSGGLDSMVLWRVLHELATRHRWRLIVVHFNHQLRSRASNADEALVRRTARQLGWPCVVERGEVRAFARQHKLSIEMAARQLRHEFLARAARRRKIRTVALAHHADDQVELFFLRLLRGAGLDGLAGMKWRSPSPVEPGLALARPMLDQDKEALRAYARQERVRFREDASNACLDHQRNRLRHELLPLLRQHYQPSLNRVVRRAMGLLEDTADFVAEEARHWGNVRRRVAFARLHPAVQRALLQGQLFRLGLSADFELVELLRQANPKPVMIRPGWQVCRDGQGFLSLRQLKPVLFQPARLEIDLSAGKTSDGFAGVVFGWKLLSGARRPAQRRGREFFDADKIGSKVILRHWQKGDRFQPIGLPKPVKLQDWFINRKVPRQRRHELIVATTGTGEIFWVEDQRIAEPFKVCSATRRRFRWTWTRKAGRSSNIPDDILERRA